MPEPEPTDVVAEAERFKAQQAARAKAIAAPQRPRRATNAGAVVSYVDKALRDEAEGLARLQKGSRNDQLNIAAFNLGQLVAAGKLDQAVVESELITACHTNGLIKEDGMRSVRKTLRSGLESGKKKPRDMSDVGTESRATSDNSNANVNDNEATHKASGADEFNRKLRMVRMARVESSVAQWVWQHDGVGCIQLGTLSMFAGRPATGKSTAARWLAAQLTNGTLPGVWSGHPVNVAACFFEEDNECMVKPSLQAAGADVSRIMLPVIDIGDGTEGQLLARADEADLTEALLDNEIRALVIDPIMSTFGGSTDINRNNEVREYLQPFVRIAKAINGIVVAVTHLNKSNNRDVLAAMNGSSAFGEVPRAVIGFMEKGPADPERVMQQVKSSAGPLPNPLIYKLIETDVCTDDGLVSTMTRFEIVGTSDISLVDIVDGNVEGEGTSEISRAVQWLHQYLLIEQPASVAETKQVARQQADISERTLQRARIKLGVKAIAAPTADKPHRQAWCLPDFRIR